MKNWLHTVKKKKHWISGHRRLGAFIALPLVIAASGHFPCRDAFGFNGKQPHLQAEEIAESFTSRDYSYYNVDYDDVQNAKYTRDSLSEQSGRSLRELSYNHLAWLKGFRPEALSKDLKKQWQGKQKTLQKILRNSDSLAEKARATEEYFQYLHSVLTDKRLSLLINRHQDFRARYEAILTRLSEDYQIFSNRALRLPKARDLNPEYFQDCLDANKQITAISGTLHEMELAYNGRPPEEQMADGTLNSWALWRLSLPLYLQKIYDHAIGNLKSSS